MDKAEFDSFADEYLSLHARNIAASGEGPEFFAEYKIRDIAEEMTRRDALPAHARSRIGHRHVDSLGEALFAKRTAHLRGCIGAFTGSRAKPLS
ncbi:hypothetical protein [Paraburkholderia sp. CI3]|uniref:hypothetical protein n=1 Tax=Paraburkholderia sp. CI3 TaxID=2991060 RepID=UPI003D24866B